MMVEATVSPRFDITFSASPSIVNSTCRAPASSEDPQGVAPSVTSRGRVTRLSASSGTATSAVVKVVESRDSLSHTSTLLMVPATVPRFVRLPGEAARYIAIETLIRRHICTIFPGYEMMGGGAFRIIRDSDIEIEEEAEDLVQLFESALKRRRQRSSCTRATGAAPGSSRRE